jgi:hypothetical protein
MEEEMEELSSERLHIKDKFISAGIERFGKESIQEITEVAHKLATTWNLKNIFGTKGFFKAVRINIINAENEKKREAEHIEYLKRKEDEKLKSEEYKQELLKEYKKIAVNELHIHDLSEAMSFVNKDDIITFLSDNFSIFLPRKIAKADLIIEAIKLLGKRKNIIKKFYSEFHEDISIHPTELEQKLNITKYKRKKMMDSNDLIVSRYENIHKYGKYIDVPMFDRYLVLGQHYDMLVKQNN